MIVLDYNRSYSGDSRKRLQEVQGQPRQLSETLSKTIIFIFKKSWDIVQWQKMCLAHKRLWFKLYLVKKKRTDLVVIAACYECNCTERMQTFLSTIPQIKYRSYSKKSRDNLNHMEKV